MIHNYSVRESKLQQISKSSFDFFLTGSTYFYGTGNDVDLFVKDSDDVRKFLISLGFKHHSSSNYKDDNCSGVMRNNDLGSQIDVQLVMDVDLKLEVQEKLKKLGIFSPTTEQWNLAFAFMLEGREQKLTTF